VPPDTWPDRAPRYGSLREACEAGVAAEVANAELYDELLAGTERADIREVYENLREASQERHLPAFRRCAARESGVPPDQDGGRRRRRRHRGG
jgi:rubrerythrin